MILSRPRRMGLALAGAVGTALLASTVLAAPKSYSLDKSHASVVFTVSHLGFTQIFGQFREFDADVVFDAEDIAMSEITFRIHAGSIDTNWARRDEHIRSGDFLDVGNHPAIVFRSTRIESTGENTARVYGDLTLVGTTQEEEFDVTLIKTGEIRGTQTAGFSATGTIDRTRYGVDYAAPAIGSHISVNISLELQAN